MYYKYIELKNKDGLIIRGIRNSSKEIETSKLPTIIIVHGLTGDKLGNKFFFVKMAKYFTEKNYNVFRFDFTGSGESDGEFENMTLTTELNDMDIIMKYIWEDETVDRDNIFMIGHSLGGLITTLKSSEYNLKKIVLLAPANDIYESAIKMYINEEIECLNYNGLKLKKEFALDIKKYKPYEKASDFQGDVLVIWGTEDVAVPKSTMENTINAFKVPAEYLELKGADHSFTDFKTRELIIDRIEKFIE